MAADRVTGADTDAETVAAPEASERRPPPDRPGAEGLPSRADSRAAAAAAKETARDQEDARPLDERAGAPAEHSAGKSAPGEPGPETDTTDGAAVVDTGAAEADRGGDDGDPFSPLDSAPQEDGQAATDEKGSRSELGEVETPDDAEGGPSDTPIRADDGVAPPAGRRKAGESPTVLDRIKDSVSGGIFEDASETIGDPVKPAENSPDAAVFRPADRERRVEPLDDRAYAEHTRHVESTVRNALQQGESTDVKHTLNPEHTRWEPDRIEIHQQIVDELYSAAADVPNDGQAIIAGGLGGAGKSTTLDDHAGVDRSKYLTINPDDIKESLGRRGMIPTVEGLAPMECSTLVHEESSQVAGLLAGRAYADRKNVIWDITMSSKSSAAKRVQQLRDAGYSDVEGIFVHIPVEKSVERAEARHRRGLEDYRNGEGLGGRYVPPDIIRSNADPAWGSVNRGVFEELKPQFDRWRVYDNSVDGRDPVLLESSDDSERNENE